MNKKRVVLMIRRDYAGMFHRLYTAINKYTKYEALHVTYESSPKYKAIAQYCVQEITAQQKWKLMRKIAICDLAIVSDDFFRLYYSNRLPQKKIVYTGSSHYRRDYNNLSEKYKELGVRRIVISTPDLKLNGNEIYIPAPFDTSSVKCVQKDVKDFEKKIVIGHICSAKHGNAGFKRKGYKIIKNTVKELMKDNKNVKWKFITGKTNKEALEELKKIDILVESINGDTGVIGYSGIEASAHGIPVITQKDNDMNNPVIYANEETLYNELDKLIKKPRLIIKHGLEQRVWCKKRHGYKVIAKRLERMFDGVLKQK